MERNMATRGAKTPNGETDEFATQWFDLPIGRTRVRTIGSGPVIVLTHGLLVDGRIWDTVARTVAASGAQVVLPDLPLGAHTVAVKDRTKLTTTTVASTLFDVADALGIDRFAVVGFDTGGAIAQVATAMHPERIDRLALMSCDAFEHFPPLVIKPIQWAATWRPSMSLVLRTLSSPRLQFLPMPLGLVAKHPIDPALVAAWSGPSATDREVRADVVAFVGQMSSVDTLAAAEKLRSYNRPSMVLWARNDVVFPKKDAHRLVALLPRGTLRWVDDSRTFASLDNPSRVSELIVEFMALPS
jgi:pimeloyl-ACP methyl ester carboxylesterase